MSNEETEYPAGVDNTGTVSEDPAGTSGGETDAEQGDAGAPAGDGE